MLHPQDAFLGRAPRLVTTMKPEPPNPACMVCGRTQLQLHINTRTTTLGQLVDKARPCVCHAMESMRARTYCPVMHGHHVLYYLLNAAVPWS